MSIRTESGLLTLPNRLWSSAPDKFMEVNSSVLDTQIFFMIISLNSLYLLFFPMLNIMSENPASLYLNSMSYSFFIFYFHYALKFRFRFSEVSEQFYY